MIKIGISGFCGKMGKRIAALVQDSSVLKLTVGLESRNHPDIGKLISGIKVSDDPDKISDCDCLIDFSMPLATLEYLEYALKYKKCIVIGTTGLDSNQQAKVKKAAQDIPVVFSPNMSVGVNLLFRLIKETAALLGDYKVHIEEAHHIHKKDSPSGTAKGMVQILNSEDFDIKNEDVKSIREDEIVGDHKIIFDSDADRLELSHSAKTRDIFAKGALLAAGWVADKPSGLYSMQDVLFGKD